MYLIDTNIFIDFLSRRSRPSIRERLRALKTGQYNTSSIVLMELRQGTARDDDPTAAWKTVEDKLLPNLTVLEFTRKDAIDAADIDAALGRRGRTLPEIDLMIGATALNHGLILVTRNVRDFRDIPGLTIENWFE